MNINTTKSVFDDAWDASSASKFEPFTGEPASSIHHRLNGGSYCYGIKSGDERFDVTTVITATRKEFSIDVTIVCGDRSECQSYWIQEETTGKILGMHPKERPSKDSLVTKLSKLEEHEMYIMRRGKMQRVKMQQKTALLSLKTQVRWPLKLNHRRHMESLKKLINEQIKDSSSDVIEQEHLPLGVINTDEV